MLSTKQRLQIVAGFATLLVAALGVGCSGFFTNPTLTAIAVGPEATINQGTQVQMTAVGTYNDGTENTIQSGVNWSSSATNIASINTGGLVTGVSPGSATITASAQAVTGTTTVTVTITGLTAIQVTPLTDTQNTTTTVQYKATGTVNGKQEDLTDIVTWTTSDTSGLVSIDSTGLLTILQLPATQTVISVTATEGTVAGNATLTLNP
jgi:hypothetical protein